MKARAVESEGSEGSEGRYQRGRSARFIYCRLTALAFTHLESVSRLDGPANDDGDVVAAAVVESFLQEILAQLQ